MTMHRLFPAFMIDYFGVVCESEIIAVEGCHIHLRVLNGDHVGEEWEFNLGPDDDEPDVGDKFSLLLQVPTEMLN
jgi:hypothetical protein